MLGEEILPTTVTSAEITVLKEELREFLEAHLNTRLVEADSGALKMLVLHSKNQNSKIKEKFINFKLGEISRRLLAEKVGEDGSLSRRDYIICEYLIEELKKYVSSRLKKK